MDDRLPLPITWSPILAAAWRYCLPVVTVGVGLFVATHLMALSDRANLFLLLSAVMVSTYYGGVGSGLLAIVLASAGAVYFLLHPVHTMAIHDFDDLLRWIFFVGASLASVLLIWRQQESQQFAERLTSAVSMFGAGADGDVGKNAQPSEVLCAVETVLEGRKHASETVGQNNAAMGLNAETSRLPHETLSSREDQVFRLLITGKGVTAIAMELQLKVATVSTYRVRILKKMNLTNNAELIRYAIKHGLLD